MWRCWIVVLAVSLAPAQTLAPDLILSNGKIITVDDRFSVAQAVAIRGDRIVAVGSNPAITQLAGPNTRRIDLRGRAVIPGLIDNHIHLLRAATTWKRELRFDGVVSRKQAVEMLRAPRRRLRVTGSTTSAAGRINSLRMIPGRLRARNWTQLRRINRSRCRSLIIRCF